MLHHLPQTNQKPWKIHGFQLVIRHSKQIPPQQNLQTFEYQLPCTISAATSKKYKCCSHLTHSCSHGIVTEHRYHKAWHSGIHQLHTGSKVEKLGLCARTCSMVISYNFFHFSVGNWAAVNRVARSDATVYRITKLVNMQMTSLRILMWRIFLRCWTTLVIAQCDAHKPEGRQKLSPPMCSLRHIITQPSADVCGGADKSLARSTSRCRRTESIVSLERGCLSMYRIASLFLLQSLKGSMSGDMHNFNNMEMLAFIKFFFLHGKVPKEIHTILIETLR